MAKVLVTGGAGFIGSHLVDALEKEHMVKVKVIDKVANKYKSKVDYWAMADIADLSQINTIFRALRPDYVFHCAAQARIQRSIDDPSGTFEANCRGTLNILLASRDFKVKRVIYSASSSAYGLQVYLPLSELMRSKPLNPYALYKYFGEELCRIFSEIYGLETVSLRYFNVYGPRQPLEGPYSTVIPKFIDQWKRGAPMTIVPDGNQRRDFTYVSDVVAANILAMTSENVGIGKGEVINIGTGENHSILEVADIIGGKNYPIVFISPRIGEAKESLADRRKAKRFLNWEPKISLENGLEILKEQIK